MLKISDKVPDLCLLNSNDEEVCIESFKGKWVIIYFYPKDNTSGCTKEAQDFTEMLEKFEQENAIVVGISPDSTKSHRNFIEKRELKHILLSDNEKEIIPKFDAWILKKMYGREYMGVDRSTFIIDPNQIVKAVWHKVKVRTKTDRHVDIVFNKLIELKKEG